MRIAIIHHQFKLKGGMETYLFNLITGFHLQRDKVSVYVYKKNKLQDTSFCDVFRKNLSWLPRSWRKYWFAYKSNKQMSKREHDLKISLMRSFNQDILICGGTHLGFLNFTQRTPSLADKIEIAFEKKSYQSSGLIVAHSKLLEEELIKNYNVSPEKIMMCYPPVNTDKFNQNRIVHRAEFRKKFNIAPDKTAILFPSTGHKRKGFQLLVEALKLLPANDYQLIVAGNKPSDQGLKNIHYVGFVEDMASLYMACDMTLLPSFYEPFGLVAIESIECGTPVIISKFVGAKDLITAKEGIILDELSSVAIAKAIQTATHFEFDIAPNFAERHELTVDAHIQKLKALIERCNLERLK